MTGKRYEKRMNFNINLPDNRCFKTEEAIVDKKEDKYEALSINDITYRLNTLHEENVELKSALKELKEIGDYQADRIKELQEFEDKVFDSLNNKIKMGEKAIEWGESNGADVGAMEFYIESLKQFKKELEE